MPSKTLHPKPSSECHFVLSLPLVVGEALSVNVLGHLEPHGGRGRVLSRENGVCTDVRLPEVWFKFSW
jgi:hypothetical protein